MRPPITFLIMMETQVRLTISEDTHKKVKRLQGIFAFKEGDKTNLHDVYTRIIDRGIAEFMKRQ